MEWSIQQIAKLAGTTSRTLRHYEQVGLLPATRTGANGYRYYDASALVRLQRILLLRELGLGLPQIGEILERQTDEVRALERHRDWLEQEKERIGRQIAAVENTIRARQKGEEPMAEQMFDGFDHTTYREEVEQRWGADAYAASDRWWTGMSADEQRAWQERTAQLGRNWTAAAERGVDPASEEAQELARRHVEWLTGIPGTPAAAPGGDVKGYVTGLGEMYVADPRFAANYGGERGAAFVRDALRVYADREL
ncbi:MerR family transcriptional regulator [Microbacterium sediminis]|uniref:MerR family transcriptional regulator n=1 Tax=Microbacterium sediminis TaxID=904291 RepID=A0A1B9NAC4_9MICO|nr:MerR family transcriptional regulator [Microbacterium sediminis]OCG73571.1 MerR family transcriptional regulator [Microbacterium sediminis]QBR73247.1 MerR family transcriptional regulator [Microbacterium sediminis]